MRLTRSKGSDDTPADDREEWMATADMYAGHLTETGARCHLNTGKPRFCSWEGVELPATDRSGEPAPVVAVRCKVHPGGRFLDPDARLAPEDFA